MTHIHIPLMNVTIFVDRYNQLDVDPFLVNTIRFEEKKILVQTDKVVTTKGENVVVSDELRNKMIKPRSLEAEVLRENVRRKPTQRIKPNFVRLINKYFRRQQREAHEQWRGFKRGRYPGH
jgi:hypothetical protein